MTRHGPGSSDLRRKRWIRPERPRILITTEGVVTEPQYFKGLKGHLRATGVSVRSASIDGIGRDPVSVVSAARTRQQRGESYDQTWCVFDVDRHSNLDEALRLAASYGYKCAVSNPCFEIWLLWHFEDRTAACSATDLRRCLRNHGLRQGKTLPEDFPYASFRQAVARSGTVELSIPNNPGSAVSELVLVIAGNYTN
jgi:hypothetical protein